MTQIARIPSLAGGVVTFTADELAGGEWLRTDDLLDVGLDQVWVPVPPNDDQLEDAARAGVLIALEQNQRARRENAAARAA
ncbi:MAG TPA: hypothetical protein VF712_10760 [Thermoleophilaceae bacterium]